MLSGKLKKLAPMEPTLVVLSRLSDAHVLEARSPALGENVDRGDGNPVRGDGKCCTISSKSNRNESLVSAEEPGFVEWGGIKFISLDNVGVSAAILKLLSKPPT